MTTLSKEDVSRMAEESGMTQYIASNNKFLEHFATLTRADLVAENGLTKLALNQKIELLKSCEQALDKAYAENERLKRMVSIANKGKKENLTECLQLTDQLTAARTALAAAEARESATRAILDQVMDDIRSEAFLFDGGNGISADTEDAADNLLAQPRDDSALREMIAGVYEECAKVCESLFDMEDDSCGEAEKCIAAIRALAEKKLASLTS